VKPIVLSFDLGGTVIAVPTYGIAVALGFVVGVVLAARQARRLGMDQDAILDLAFWILVSGVAGSRLLFVALHAGDFVRLCAGAGGSRSAVAVLKDCTAALRVWEGGLVFYGGALTAAAVAALFSWKRRLPFRKVADLFVPGLALGHALGRIGCFAAGCCFGKVCPPDALGVPCAPFPPGSVAHGQLVRDGVLPATAELTPPLHLTQLYEAIGELAIFFALLAWRRRQRAHGELTLLYALGYAILRNAIEIFRGDTARRLVVEIATPGLAKALGLPPGEALFLSTSQMIGFAVAIGAVVALKRMRQGGRAGGKVES
jgi:phosphatidylglycerol---prolipoprotein diacylglyceryl transferase